MLFWCNQKQNTKAKLCPPLHAQQLLPAALTVITGAIPTRIIFLTALETTKAATFRLVEPFKLSEPTQAATANGVAGMAAAVCSQAIFVPIDVSGHATYNGGLDVARKVLKVDGIRGLYRGQYLSGLVAMASCITMPLDTMKTSLQVMGHEKKHTVREVVKGLVADDGWKGLYRGLGPRFFTMSAWGTLMNDEIAKTFVDLIIVNYCIGKFKPNACV
ncbi:unnamed protein product [Camellia sinensis]